MNNNHLEDYKIMSFDNQTKKVLLITSHQSKYLRLKGAEQFRIPGVWFIFVVLDVEETICSVVEHFGDGPSQAGASLCGFCWSTRMTKSPSWNA